MEWPVVCNRTRGLGYKFMVAEAWWILTGQNRVDTIKKYSKEIARFSDDTVYFSGAYGPRIVDQLSYIVDCLYHDQNTRQAICTIWRSSPRPSKDIPCTVAVQWFIRSGRLNCIDTMRSSDAWLGWPYDIFNFTMLSAYIRELLIKRDDKFKDLKLGKLWLNAGSQHLYEPDIPKVEQVLGKSDHYYSQPWFNAGALEIGVINYLEEMKDYEPTIRGHHKGGFLDELFYEVYGSRD